jgi:hypothetical protein
MLTAVSLAGMIAGGVGAVSPASGQNDPQVRSINAAKLPFVHQTDERFQSYQIGFSHLTGGETWKSFEKLGGQPAKSIAEAREARSATDLENRRLRNLTAALAPLYIRYSGTTANNVYFQDNDAPQLAVPPKGYKVVLTRKSWKVALEFADAVNAKVVTSFTISSGVRDSNHDWTPAMAKPWLAYTRKLGRSIYAAELYNEPNAPEYPELPKGYSADQYGRDFNRFRSFMGKAAPAVKLAGPGNAMLGIPGVEAIMKPSPEDYAQANPRPRFAIFSYHFYPVLSQRCAAANSSQSIAADKALDPEFLARPERQLLKITALRDRYAPGAPIWLTETGGAACGGLQWQPTFLDMFRYADTHARLAKGGLDAIFTHALISGSNGVIDEKTLEPNASYWSAVLWRKLMGRRVLDAGVNQTGLHVYAHCLRGSRGGVALLALNMKDRADAVGVEGRAAVYSLTAPELQGKTVMLNGKPLAIGKDDSVPAMLPRAASGQVELAPYSVNFIALPRAGNAACRS